MKLWVVAVSCLFATAAFAAPAALPTWFPPNIVSINPDNLTVEDFGTQQLKVGANADQYDTVEAKGHHWTGSVYPPGAPEGWDKWNGLAAWKAIRPQLEKQGFKIVYQKPTSDSIDVTLRKGSGADAS